MKQKVRSYVTGISLMLNATIWLFLSWRFPVMGGYYFSWLIPILVYVYALYCIELFLLLYKRISLVMAFIIPFPLFVLYKILTSCIYMLILGNNNKDLDQYMSDFISITICLFIVYNINLRGVSKVSQTDKE